MRCNLYDERGEHLLLAFDATPECGVDFCDGCGDCLDCQGWECRDGMGCRWVLYANDLDEFLEEHSLPEKLVAKLRSAVSKPTPQP